MDGPRRQQLTELMTRLADGDRGAFAPVYRELWPVVAAYCRRALGAADGEDAAQQALVSVFARAGEFDREREALPWVIGIAAWECRTLRRKRQRRGETGLEAAGRRVDPAADAETLASERELVAFATELLGGLRAADAQVIEEALGLGGDGAARAGVAPATFRKRLERALERLRQAWRSRHGLS